MDKYIIPSEENSKEQSKEQSDRESMIDSLDLLKRITNISSMGVHVVDAETREMYYSNEAGFRLIGMEPCDFQGRTCHEVFFGWDEPCANCRLEHTKQGEHKHEVYIPQANKTFLTNSELATWNGKNVYIEYITDITDSKKREEALRKSEQELEDKYAFEKYRGVISGYNMFARSLSNLTNRTVIEVELYQALKPREADDIMTRLVDFVAELALDKKEKADYLKLHDEAELLKRYEAGEHEINFDLRCKLPSGRICWVRNVLHMLRQPKGTDILLFEYIYDVNKTKSMNMLMEFAVSDEYNMLGSVNFMDRGAVMIYGADSYGAPTNPLVEENYDVALQRFTDDAVDIEESEEFLEKAALDKVQKILETQNAYEFSFHTMVEGQRRTKKIRYVSSKKVKGMCFFFENDITELLQEEQKKQDELKAALDKAKKANQYKTTFLSQMSHEIRTPMNAIIGMARLAEEAEDLEEKNNYIQKIEYSSDFLLGIINDILDMSKIENGKFELHPQWQSGKEHLKSCIDMLKPAMEKKNIHFEYPKLKSDVKIEYYVDALRMRQIYMNLLNNAIKFTPEGGTITLTVKNLEYDDTISKDLIQVSDTGCGMSPEFLTRIFRPFEQERNPYSDTVQGTGLGLAIVKQIVTEMGGQIYAESTLGQGSTFSLILPYPYRIKEETKEKSVSAVAAMLKGKRVLLVEDHPLNREIATKLLEKAGMVIETANDGAEAVARFGQVDSGYYDLILMDIRMPNMDGITATKTIRALEKEDAKTIPIIAMTANAFDDDVQATREAGMNDHLAKPIEVEKMFATIGKYI